MKSILNNINTQDVPTTQFEGTVIDPATKRMCATAADIARGAGVHPSTIARITTARRYAGGRYLDIADVLTELAKARHCGRPKRGSGTHPQSPRRADEKEAG
jgi:hypothetical protein